MSDAERLQAIRLADSVNGRTARVSVKYEKDRDELEAENAKLRELVRHLYKYRQLYFKTGIYPTDHGVTERRMHELGVEVD